MWSNITIITNYDIHSSNNMGLHKKILAYIWYWIVIYFKSCKIMCFAQISDWGQKSVQYHWQNWVLKKEKVLQLYILKTTLTLHKTHFYMTIPTCFWFAQARRYLSCNKSKISFFYIDWSIYILLGMSYRNACWSVHLFKNSG